MVSCPWNELKKKKICLLELAKNLPSKEFMDRSPTGDTHYDLSEEVMGEVAGCKVLLPLYAAGAEYWVLEKPRILKGSGPVENGCIAGVRSGDARSVLGAAHA